MAIPATLEPGGGKVADSITLKLEGSRAKRGVTLSDFESFIDHFLAALRDFDRDRRGETTQKPGRPDARAQAVTSFRLTAFREGSGIATIEPALPPMESDTEPMMDIEEVPMANLKALLKRIEDDLGLPVTVRDSLDAARRAVGDDGSVEIDLPGTQDGAPRRRVLIDGPRIDRLGSANVTDPELRSVTSISGRLHLVDFEPDRLAIRAADGVNWSCTYPESLERQIQELANRLVWAGGSGRLQSPTKGKMEIAEIHAVEETTQTSLFTETPVPTEVLEAEQGITGPQGLDSFGVDEWTDEDEAWLKALTDG